MYMAGTEGPVVFCLHGGGYSGYVCLLHQDYSTGTF